MTQTVVDKTSEYSAPEAYAAPQRGIYVMLVYNDSELSVFDRNGDGHLAVRPKAYTVKSGKFENGLSTRMQQNYVHAHRRGTDGVEKESGIFPSMLKLLLVHHMPESSASDVRALETELNREVRNFLAENAMNEPEQGGHSESRRILGEPPSRRELESLFTRVVERHHV